MSNSNNIFNRLAKNNDYSNFENIIDTSQQYPEGLDLEPNANIFERMSKKLEAKKNDNFNFLDTVRDIGEQVVSKGISGIGGAYGNILDTFGLQLKEGETLPGQQAINSIQSEILDRINKGEVPSYGELMLLSDEDVTPSLSRLPTSKEISSGIEKFTGIGEGKTPSGRIAGRGAEFAGEGLATGGGAKALLSLGASGLFGQGIREAGGPEGLATGVEIGGALLPSGISKKLIPTKKTKEIVDAGRKIGLDDKLITPLIQSENKAELLSKVSRKGPKTKKLFANIKEKLGDSYETIKSSPEAGRAIPIVERSNLIDEFNQIRGNLSKTLAPSPDKEAAIKFIETSVKNLSNSQITPEHLVNFWQDINKSVKWNSIQGGKKALAQLKKPILESLQKVSPQIAKDFEMTNQLYSKYAQISKRLKPDIIDSFISKAEVLAIPGAAISLVSGNPFILSGLASEHAMRVLGREMLINPYFQNVATKLVKNFNQSSLKGMTQSVNQVKEYLDRKHPNEDWSFLIKD